MSEVLVTVHGKSGQEATYGAAPASAVAIITDKTAGFARTIIDGGNGTCLDIPLDEVVKVTFTFV